MRFAYKLYYRLTGKNASSTPPDLIQEQLKQKRALPIGVAEFHEWAERIISGAMIPATAESQKFGLANVLLNLGPTVAFEADLYFIHVLRKTAVNQIADAIRTEIRDAAKARLLAEEALKQQGEVTPPPGDDAKVLEIKRV